MGTGPRRRVAACVAPTKPRPPLILLRFGGDLCFYCAGVYKSSFREKYKSRAGLATAMKEDMDLMNDVAEQRGVVGFVSCF